METFQCALLVLFLRDIKLALFETKFALCVLVFEAIFLFIWNRFRWETTPLLVLQCLCMLTTLTIALYNSKKAVFKSLALLNRVLSLIVIVYIFYPLNEYVFNPTVPLISWITLAIINVFVAQKCVLLWNDWFLASNSSIVTSMKSLASSGPFSKEGNIILWCMINSLCEEVFSRLFLFETLVLSGVGVQFAIFAQGVDFGLLHLNHGFPNGISGFILSTIFGILQGILYLWSGGILLPWIVHAAVDIIIFTQI